MNWKSLITLALLWLPGLFADEYKIDGSHSKAGFAVKHLMVSTVRGDFSKVSGTIIYDEKNPAATKVNATIEVSAINTNEAKRDEHLKSPDFFDIAKFPTITFVSKSAKKTADGIAVTGDLTIHGVTKEVVLNVDGPTAEVKDPWGNARRGATATTKINRKDFGLTWNKALETGGVMVSDEVAITVDVEGVKAAKK